MNKAINFKGELKRGMWVEMSLYSVGLGVIIGTENCNSNGYSYETDAVSVTRCGGNVEVVYLDGQRNNLPEQLLRTGTQYWVLDEQPELASEEKIKELIANSDAFYKAKKDAESAEMMALEEAVNAIRVNDNYKHLEQLGKYADIKDVAKNIRKELKKQFKGEKFSVRCSSGTLSDSINVYINGDTDRAEVERVLKPFKTVVERNQRDGYTDHVSDAFNEVFGSVEYLFVNK